MDSRNVKIASATVIFVVLVGALVYLNIELLIPKIDDELTQCEGENCIVIYGNVKQNISFSVDYLYNETYERVENVEMYFINSFGTDYSMKISGVQIHDILTKLDILNDNATHVQFQASDGFKSPELPISVISNFPDQVLFTTHERGNLIKSKENGGDGPIKGFVSVPALESNDEMVDWFQNNNNYGGTHVYNTVFSVKWVTSILVI